MLHEQNAKDTLQGQVRVLTRQLSESDQGRVWQELDEVSLSTSPHPPPSRQAASFHRVRTRKSFSAPSTSSASFSLPLDQSHKRPARRCFETSNTGIQMLHSCALPLPLFLVQLPLTSPASVGQVKTGKRSDGSVKAATSNQRHCN